LLIATDQEGGRVQRLRGKPFTRLPSGADVGAKNSLPLAERLGEVIARELRAVGIHWDFAPVCDLRFPETNAEIGNRALGKDPQRVGELIAAEVAGFQKGGVLPCLKHFPGQGATAVDSHFHLPSLAGTTAQLMTREMVPFQQVLRKSPRSPLSIMAAHILTPGVDKNGLPATLNPALLTDLLRRRLGFAGLVITDDLEMAPIAERFGVGKAAVQAINAGADMVLVCHTMDAQVEARNALLAAARSGALPSARIEEALRRIQGAKRQMLARPAVPLAVIGCAAHQEVVQAIRANE
jgi:beta-N-acetylhexosaminidase